MSRPKFNCFKCQDRGFFYVDTAHDPSIASGKFRAQPGKIQVDCDCGAAYSKQVKPVGPVPGVA